MIASNATIERSIRTGTPPAHASAADPLIGALTAVGRARGGSRKDNVGFDAMRGASMPDISST
jgi:hypothetical protein